jgi:hypothetical protein
VNKRLVVLGILVTGMLVLPGCRKSESSKPPNFFGTPPVVSEVSITKLANHYECTLPSLALCCIDPPVCSCCCSKDQVQVITADLDMVKVSAKVTDADGASDLLVILTRFFDPPSASSKDEISLEMFDVGTTPVGSIDTGTLFVNVLSGDTAAGDGIYARNFYMKSTTAEQPRDCILSTDKDRYGGTFSQFQTQSSFPATRVLNYDYHVEAVDRAGNITSSSTVTLPITESDVTLQLLTKDCGPPSGNGGCLPPP